MERLTSLIRADKEFKNYLSVLESAYKQTESLPIAINGLSGGAASAFICESVIEARKLTSSPVLILVENEGERERLLETLRDSGISCLGYKKRDLVFHNIKASHDIERERLSVLTAVLENTVDAVIATPSAASLYTIPEGELLPLVISIDIGDILPPDKLADRLVSLGFMSSDAVEGRGQFSRRGGIVDFWCGESDMPVRIEFFGDEVDRISYFDPITQRSSHTAKSIKLLPASEVMLNREART